MEHEGLHSTVQTYNSVIDAIARRGENPQQAETIIDRMTKAGVLPDVVTYTAVINGMFHFSPVHASSSLRLLVCRVHFCICQLGRSLMSVMP
jgi:pentatricopeptide repeat protein